MNPQDSGHFNYGTLNCTNLNLLIPRICTSNIVAVLEKIYSTPYQAPMEDQLHLKKTKSPLPKDHLCQVKFSCPITNNLYSNHNYYKSLLYQQIVITDVRSWTEEIFEVVIVVVTGKWLYHCQFYHYKQFVIKIKNNISFIGKSAEQVCRALFNC